MSEFHPIIKEITQASNSGLDLIIDEMIRHLRIFIFSSIYPVLQHVELVEGLRSSKDLGETHAERLFKFAEDATKAVELFEREHTALIQLKKVMFSV